MWDRLFQPMDTLQKGLSVGWKRNAVIRNNIANVETPNFKSSYVEFESLLRKAAEDDGKLEGRLTHTRHIPIGGRIDLNSIGPQVFRNEELSMRMDGNNVDIEAENVKLAQNSIQYNTIMEKLNSEIRRLKTAISEGR